MPAQKMRCIQGVMPVEISSGRIARLIKSIQAKLKSEFAATFFVQMLKHITRPYKTVVLADINWTLALIFCLICFQSYL